MRISQSSSMPLQLSCAPGFTLRSRSSRPSSRSGRRPHRSHRPCPCTYPGHRDTWPVTAAAVVIPAVATSVREAWTRGSLSSQSSRTTASPTVSVLVEVLAVGRSVSVMQSWSMPSPGMSVRRVDVGVVIIAVKSQAARAFAESVTVIITTAVGIGAGHVFAVAVLVDPVTADLTGLGIDGPVVVIAVWAVATAPSRSRHGQRPTVLVLRSPPWQSSSFPLPQR